MMNEDFNIKESHTVFDFRGFLYRLLHHWPLFLVSIVISFALAYYINVRKLPVYKMENLVAIKDEQNPFFTSNTSLVFNWGGTTDKVNTAIISLASRSHNEKVVDRLQYYLTYLRDGEYQQVDAYNQTPFIIEVDTLKSQMLDEQFQIVFRDSANFTLSVAFDEGREITLQNYSDREKMTRYVEKGEFSETFRVGQQIATPFFNGVVLRNPEVVGRPGTPYYFIFEDYDSTVKRYLNIQIIPETRGSSVLRMSLTGSNKAKLVDYLNTSVSVLAEDMLKRKNLFATKTIKFIDSSLAQKSAELSLVEDELNRFKNQNSIFNLENEGSNISAKLNELDIRKEVVNRELSYYNTLQEYLQTHSDYRNVPAPSVAGISEASVVNGVGQIVNLAQERNKLQYSFKDEAPIFSDIDRQINAVKRVLLENIRSSKNLKQQELATIRRDVARYEEDIKKLPKEQQGLLKIERRYNLSENTYNLFLAKRSEAGLVKAANVSDVVVIDPAKDTGGGKIGPNTQLNYVMAGLFSLFFPIIIVFVRVFFDTQLRDSKMLEKVTPIPLLGVIGRSNQGTNLAVLNKPKSALSEAFRNLRSSLQFMYKEQGIVGAKTVLITSSVSGEGKTFCSINLASIFALSEKKTVLVELDLRKPKITLDFNMDNTVGVSNFLIGGASLDDVLQKTEIEYLDVIPSGPIPPNPSELLINQHMEQLINLLKERYDYIILDSPPLGLVADSLQLTKHVDATLYIARLNYSNRNMFTFVNEKYERGEIKNVSIVLNDYVEKGGYSYIYGHGYGYGYGYGTYGAYGNGYHETTEKPSLWNRLKKMLNSK